MQCKYCNQPVGLVHNCTRKTTMWSGVGILLVLVVVLVLIAGSAMAEYQKDRYYHAEIFSCREKEKALEIGEIFSQDANQGEREIVADAVLRDDPVCTKMTLVFVPEKLITTYEHRRAIYVIKARLLNIPGIEVVYLITSEVFINGEPI